MAIVKMKKLALVALGEDREDLLRAMQEMQCIEITEQILNEGDSLCALEVREESMLVEEQIVLLVNAMASLSRYAPEKRGMFSQREIADKQRVQDITLQREELLAHCRTIAVKESAIADIRQHRVRLEAQIEQLHPMLGCDVPLEQIEDTTTTNIMLGTIAQAPYDALLGDPSASSLMQLMEVGNALDTKYILVLSHKANHDAVATCLASAGFTKLVLHYAGTAKQATKILMDEIAKEDKQKGEAIADIVAKSETRRDLEVAYDLAIMRKERVEASARLTGTRDAIRITGWVPADVQDKIQATLEAVTPRIVIEFEQPQELEAVPTFVRNNNFIAPFEAITDMFSTPSQSDVDPTPRLMPFFLMFFGMMVSDAAYGIVLTILGLVGTYVLKMRGMLGQICKILITGGLATVFWGILFGSWFGIEGIKAPLFSPLDNPMPMLGLCCGLGVVHLFTGMIIKANMAWRAGDWQTAVLDQYAWILLIVGLGAFGGGAVLGIPLVADIGKIVSIVCVLVILLFSARDKKWGIGRIFSGLGALYGISSYLSDILSYARLFAMGLATGVICMVFNRIAGMLAGSPIGYIFAIVVLIFGHVFNLAINALGAYVHSCRLQYIEYFGKFFEGGGRAFKPLMRKTKYVDLKNS